MKNAADRAAITANAKGTYEWYLSNMRWLKLHLTAEEAAELEKHCRALEAILNKLPLKEAE